MALTIRNITDETIEQAKTLTGKGTASAALVECVELARTLSIRADYQADEIRQLRERLRHLDQVQTKLASACDEALTIVRQRDWISS